jgi:DNA (cytosine-5)-methyltransferase 1
LNYLSVFSGIEAASVAWEGLGFEPVGFSEIDPFASAVLAYQFPTVRNYGDINNFKEWKIDKPIRIVVGGSPCQSFSRIGNRRGTEDVRGSLMFTYGNLINYFKPQWIIWENVPGIFSSKEGNDFAQFLSRLDECGYGLAWRVLDAQYFGVPQKRRRVFVVGYFGDVRRPAAVLFDNGAKEKSDKTMQEKIKKEKRPRNNRVFDDTRKNIVGIMPQGGNRIEVYNEKLGTLLKNMVSNRPMVYIEERDILRVITPLEVERAMGFPDNYTKIPFNKRKVCSDTYRYGALGNSMSVHVMRWLGERILFVEKLFSDNAPQEREREREF